MSHGRIPGRIALVTGASSGLGRAISLRFAAEGAKICCVDLYDRPRNKTNATTGKADDFNNRIEGESTVEDITTPTKLIHIGVKKYGRLDILANNAGISVESTHAVPHGIHELSESDWDKTMAINVKGVFLGCKYGIRQMLKQDPLPGRKDLGWIVNTASVQGLVAYHNTPAYTASKGAVAQLTKQVALDYAANRIHCNAIAPGFLRTIMTQNLQNDPDKFAEINKAHPFGGMGSPGDVAKAALFLVSDDVAWITGVNLPVDGGYMIM
ncbi:hypothetical protein M409DRAFT_35571 [Zasmidium cellare ATCC 36951]|uniref:Uncharacterized protein n=1 Tax=Zasmidium cellare ATCC 36951 TaxID=1080233 RepID=A0A6A6CZG5_ZASCE|nr:uncharacterized protein M409DRAFT_35571 [Zasmidium cellare ATCC 36951]KAF2172544.1 hypothetical protein M409DRAFT_35571 [Zasmidium cellare ATCC 36951]